jgi:hypothetical protein
MMRELENLKLENARLKVELEELWGHAAKWQRAAESQNRQWAEQCESLTEERARSEALEAACQRERRAGRAEALAACAAALRDRAQRYVGHEEGHDRYRAEHIESDAAYLEREVTL